MIVYELFDTFRQCFFHECFTKGNGERVRALQIHAARTQDSEFPLLFSRSVGPSLLAGESLVQGIQCQRAPLFLSSLGVRLEIGYHDLDLLLVG